MDEETLQERLREHLAETRPSMEFTVTPVALGIDGWAFFETVAHAHDARPSYEVVREDGTVVTGDPVAELERIYRSMEVHERRSALRLAGAAAALLADGTRPVDRPEEVRRWDDRVTEGSLELPETRYEGEDLVVSFWVRTVGRGIRFHEYAVSVSPGYDVEYDVEK